jgi:hypothetical protein
MARTSISFGGWSPQGGVCAMNRRCGWVTQTPGHFLAGCDGVSCLEHRWVPCPGAILATCPISSFSRDRPLLFSPCWHAVRGWLWLPTLASTLVLTRRLKSANVRWREVAGPMANGVYRMWLGIGRWCGWFAWPILSVLLVRSGSRSRRNVWWRWSALVSLIVGPPLAQVFGGRARKRIIQGVLAGLAEQAVYGAGVIIGCVRAGTLAPVIPSIDDCRIWIAALLRRALTLDVMPHHRAAHHRAELGP